jgi:hypothetical protein
VERLKSVRVRHVLKHEIVNSQSFMLIIRSIHAEHFQFRSADGSFGKLLVVLVAIEQNHRGKQILLKYIWLLKIYKN